MSLKEYETICILRADLTDENGKKIQDRMTDLITRFQGKEVLIKDMGKKPLAYRISKNTKGHYLQLNFLGNGQVIEELERFFRLSEDVIRFLTVRAEKKSETPVKEVM